MIDKDLAPYAALLLRVTLGFLFLAHAATKILVITPEGTALFFISIGLPGPLAYVVITAEIIGGIALVLGYHSRIAAMALLPILFGAILFAHGANGWLFSNPHGGWEYPAFWATALVVHAMTGEGVFSIRSCKLKFSLNRAS